MTTQPKLTKIELSEVKPGYPASRSYVDTTTEKMNARKCGFFMCRRTFADGSEVETYAAKVYGKLVKLTAEQFQSTWALWRMLAGNSFQAEKFQSFLTEARRQGLPV